MEKKHLSSIVLFFSVTFCDHSGKRLLDETCYYCFRQLKKKKGEKKKEKSVSQPRKGDYCLRIERARGEKQRQFKGRREGIIVHAEFFTRELCTYEGEKFPYFLGVYKVLLSGKKQSSLHVCKSSRSLVLSTKMHFFFFSAYSIKSFRDCLRRIHPLFVFPQEDVTLRIRVID